MIKLKNGIAINGDCTSQDTFNIVKSEFSHIDLIHTDPPYGKILKNNWDKADNEKQFVDWMINWVNLWGQLLQDNSAFYIWGGIGIPKFRPFYSFLSRVENETDFILSNHITWKKKRAYGVQNNYLFTREELAFLIKKDAKHPRVFNIPLLEKERGYEGYNKKYPAKSKFLRRTNVWDDVTEVLKNKRHDAQKAARVVEIPIEVSSNPGEVVLDMFGGGFTTPEACIKLNRQYVVIEKDSSGFATGVDYLKSIGE